MGTTELGAYVESLIGRGDDTLVAAAGLPWGVPVAMIQAFATGALASEQAGNRPEGDAEESE